MDTASGGVEIGVGNRSGSFIGTCDGVEDDGDEVEDDTRWPRKETYDVM
jgi:hypothetical protein